MHPVVILLIGVVIVVGGVLLFRLHAFLALVLGALAVGALTSSTVVRIYETEKRSTEIIQSTPFLGQWELFLDGSDFRATQQLIVIRPEPGGFIELGTAFISRIETVTLSDGAEVSQAIALTRAVEIAPRAGDLVATRTDLSAASKIANMTVGERVAAAFGTTCGKIGILIAMAAIIGKCLLDSGAADKIVRSALKVVGERGAPVAFAGSGFLLGIPVFFDTVFYLMMPLGKAMRMRTKRNYLLYILTIVAGGSMAHSLVPPTPGPLLVSEELGVDIGLMILGGTLVGLCSSAAAFLYASFMNKRYEVPLRESADFSLEDLENLAQQDESSLPPLLLSLAPIVLPVIFIAGYTIIKSLNVDLGPDLMAVAATLGNKNIALTIAAAIAMAMLIWKRRTNLKDLAASVQSALSSCGVIILITAAGGAFGGVLQQTGVATLIRDIPAGSYQVILILAFLITTAIRTAQGSATVAMITAVGVLGGFATGGLGCHPLYLALAIGCGSKPIAWMNDSGFWVICKMSGMTETEGLKYVTPMSILMGVTGLIATLIAATLFPMV